GLALGILTADCAPILFHDAQAEVIGACHAGWKGALSGVIEATLAEMQRLGAQPQRIAAVIGPTIGPDWYEVGPEYQERFMADAPENTRFFRPSPHGGHALFDLPGYCQHRLRTAGIADPQWIGTCTYADETRFFSNRRALHRSEGDYGRLLSGIVV
ncbi:MAG: laccase domain-containing protein, partial [Pseudomonadota bacterium]